MKWLICPVLLLALMVVTGCNTIEGVGQDISGGARRVGDMM